jgi:UPF0716 protein FxsA
MFGRLLALFIVIPFVELFILIRLGQAIDVWWTLAIIIATGYLGATLARRQGRAVLAQLKQQLSAGQIPAAPAVDGVLILVAGAFLITPGLLTDTAGLLLLLPPIRARIRDALQGSFRQQLSSQMPPNIQWPPGFGDQRRSPSGDVIDIEPDAPSPYGATQPTQSSQPVHASQRPLLPR